MTFLIHKTIPELHSDQDFYPMAELSETNKLSTVHLRQNHETGTHDWNMVPVQHTGSFGLEKRKKGVKVTLLSLDSFWTFPLAPAQLFLTFCNF